MTTMTRAFGELIQTDYKHILEHPELSTDTKIGYLLAVAVTKGQVSSSLGDSAAEIRKFVYNYLRTSY